MLQINFDVYWQANGKVKANFQVVGSMFLFIADVSVVGWI